MHDGAEWSGNFGILRGRLCCGREGLRFGTCAKYTGSLAGGWIDESMSNAGRSSDEIRFWRYIE